MKKKNLKTGLEALLGGSGTESSAAATERQAERPAAPAGAKKSATFKYDEEHLKKLKALAFWEDKLIQDIVAEALEDYFTRYEKEKGEIRTR